MNVVSKATAGGSIGTEGRTAESSVAAGGAQRSAEGAIERQAEEQSALFELTDRLYRAETLDEAFDAALDAIRRSMGCERASILLLDDDGVMRFVAWRDLSEAYRRTAEGHSPWPAGARDPQPVFCEDLDLAGLDDRLAATVRAEGIGALGFIPVVADGRLVGKFMTYYADRHVFGPEDRAMALTIARQLGFGVERIRADDVRRKAQEQQALLLREMNHRVKNILSIVSGVVALSARYTPATEDLPRAIRDRINALVLAHDMILPGDDRQRADTSLSAMIRAVLAPYAGPDGDGADTISTDGPDVSVSGSVVTTLALILHELATNAVKYGSLSQQGGRIAIEWSAGDELVMRWIERGGPSLNGAPSTAGFGSHLLRSSITGSLGGRISQDWGEEGLTIELAIPIGRLG